VGANPFALRNSSNRTEGVFGAAEGIRTLAGKVISKILSQDHYFNGRRQTGIINSSTNLKKRARILNN
ncbi:hypothetical protein DRO66_08115, partial [Candidatus Bathyarchaeota archaeon]